MFSIVGSSTTGYRCQQIELVTILHQAFRVLGQGTALAVEHQGIAQVRTLVERLAKRNSHLVGRIQEARERRPRSDLERAVDVVPAVANAALDEDPEAYRGLFPL